MSLCVFELVDYAKQLLNEADNYSFLQLLTCLYPNTESIIPPVILFLLFMSSLFVSHCPFVNKPGVVN